MKKFLVILLVFVLVCGCAYAQGPDEPALKNPAERYTSYVEATDGSEQLLYAIVDSANDEELFIEKNGALKINTCYVDEAGQTTGEVDIYMQDSDFGRMIISVVEAEKFTQSIYQLGTDAYIAVGEILVEQSEDEWTQEDFDWYFDSYRFPYGSLKVLHGSRQDENGYTYYLIKSSDSMTFEFATDADMAVQQLRVYTVNDSDELVLNHLVNYSEAEPLEIPRAVQDAIKEDQG